MSRLRRSVTHLFDVFAEVAAPTGNDRPWLLCKYPNEYADEGVLKAITEFTFPLGTDTPSSASAGSNTVQLFSFVLTDGSGQYTFGYCRHTPSSNTCLCICSGLPWTNVFHQILNHISVVMNTAPKLEVVAPDHHKLPTVTDNRNLFEYYSAVGERLMMEIYACMLRERRVIFTCDKLSLLSSCVQAAGMLLYPMHWQHIFIPVLPKHLLSYLSAPMPYVIGVPSSTLAQARTEVDLSESVVVHINEKQLTSPYTDYQQLPSEVKSILKCQLDATCVMVGDGLARSFLRANIALFGNYRQGLKRDEHGAAGKKISFDTDQFIESQRSSLRSSLRELRHLQIFQQFVDERVDALNSGVALQDEFECELQHFEYKQPTNNTANMVKERGQKAISGLKARVNEIKRDASSPNQHMSRQHSSAATLGDKALDKVRSMKSPGRFHRNTTSLKQQSLHNSTSSESPQFGTTKWYEPEEREWNRTHTPSPPPQITHIPLPVPLRIESDTPPSTSTGQSASSYSSPVDLIDLSLGEATPTDTVQTAGDVIFDPLMNNKQSTQYEDSINQDITDLMGMLTTNQLPMTKLTGPDAKATTSLTTVGGAQSDLLFDWNQSTERSFETPVLDVPPRSDNRNGNNLVSRLNNV